MSIKPSLFWNDKIVMGHLIQAAGIHRRLPEVKVAGYHSIWPEFIKDEWARYYDSIYARSSLGSPMAPEVTYHEEVMALLPLLDRPKQELLWMRANKIPWKVLIEDLNRSKASLFRDRGDALETLISHLSRIDPRGDHFRTLRNRAHTSVWCAQR